MFVFVFVCLYHHLAALKSPCQDPKEYKNLVRTLEQSGQARLGTRPASLRFSVYPKQIIDITTLRVIAISPDEILIYTVILPIVPQCWKIAPAMKPCHQTRAPFWIHGSHGREMSCNCLRFYKGQFTTLDKVRAIGAITDILSSASLLLIEKKNQQFTWYISPDYQAAWVITCDRTGSGIRLIRGA